MYWHARFLVGHLEIDADHLRLFAMLSRLHRRVQLGSDPAMDNALAEFVVALEQHQDREEVILAELGYDHLVEHAHHHRALTTRAAAALAMGGDGDWLLTVHLLTQTVLEHVAMEDVGLQEFFAGQGRADSHEKPMAGTAVLLPFVRPPQEMA
jgi:hemerythrin-like metal-binding protein